MDPLEGILGAPFGVIVFGYRTWRVDSPTKTLFWKSSSLLGWFRVYMDRGLSGWLRVSSVWGLGVGLGFRVWGVWGCFRVYRVWCLWGPFRFRF